MKRLYFVLIAIFFLTVCAQAQETVKFEYGKPSELKGLKKIFIETGGDFEERSRILKEFEKAKLPDISILDGADGAEIILQFAGGTYEKTEGNDMSIDTKLRSTGKGVAYIPTNSKNTRRVIMSVQDTKENVLDKKPSVKFVREFIKVYKEANGLK